MLLNNYTVLNRNTGRDMGNRFTNPHAQFKATLFPRFYMGEHVVTDETDKSAFNNGYNVVGEGGYAYWLSPKAGGLAGNHFEGAGSLTASGANGLGGVAELSGSGDITQAEAGLIVSAIANLLGTGDITQAAVNAVLPAIAALSGSGSLSSTITAIAELITSLTGSGSPSVTINAQGELNASIIVTGDALSSANVAEAVWSALAEGGFTYAQCLQIIAAACGGKTSNSGQTFRDLSDTKDRITGTVSGNDRTGVSYELD